jgi:hypothetical protein
MKNTIKKMVKAIAGICALAAVFAMSDNTGGTALAMSVVAGVAGGKHVINEPLTVALTNVESPDLLVNEIDRRLVKIRPMATPIDQLSRWAGSKKSGSMVVDYYSVDTRPTSTKVTRSVEGCSDNVGASRFQKVQLPVENADLFEASETVLVRGVGGYKPDGKTKSNQDLVLYVLRKSEDGASISAVTVNGQTIGEFENCIPTIPEGTMLVRMGRAASELDVQTPQFEALPQKSQNYCQIFKMQIEQSTLQKIANKEVGWTFSDQEEAAIYDMRQAFTGNAGNKRKVLIGGSGLIELLNQMEQTKVVMAGENIVKWGIDFSEMHSKFGKLYILLSEVFDECGMEYNGMIIDPEYLQKYSHIPFTTEQLNLKQAGVRNTDALVLTEASCMTLRYPKAHLRIIGE